MSISAVAACWEKGTENLIFCDKIEKLLSGRWLAEARDRQRIGETGSRLSGDITITSLDYRHEDIEGSGYRDTTTGFCVLSMTSTLILSQ